MHKATIQHSFNHHNKEQGKEIDNLSRLPREFKEGNGSKWGGEEFTAISRRKSSAE
jgi:hypothetical protein